MSYIALATTTLGSAASSVTFSSIPATYKDLIVVLNGQISFPSDGFITLRLNGDTGSNYNTVYTANASSASRTNVAGADLLYGASSRGMTYTSIMDYSATDKHKTMLNRAGNTSDSFVFMSAHRWANTNAVNSVTILTTTTGFSPTGSLSAGMTLSLYGVA
jgi:hypothetical protein